MVDRSWIASAFPRNDESGIAAVFIGLWIVVLIGFGAYALDTSRIYNEHSELQNGADAAALAVARDCAMGACDGFFDAVGMAEDYSDANMRDGSSFVEDVVVDLVDNTVEVKVATEDTPGDNTFDMVLAQVIGYNGLTVRADAEVGWGPPGAIKTLPLIFSLCEWEDFGYAGYVDEHPDGFLHRASSIDKGFAPYKSKYLTILFHGTDTCHSGPSGQDLPGGFGWLESTTGYCEAFVAVGKWMDLDPGSSPTTECSPLDLQDLVGEIVGIPYFDKTTANGAGGQYCVFGIGAFYVTGYNFAGHYKQNSIITGKSVCKGEVRCIEGYMIGDYVLPASGIGGPDLGVVALEMRN